MGNTRSDDIEEFFRKNIKMANTLSVGLGELVVSRNPDDVLVAYGLGSCVGIGMFNPATRTGGLLHAVLPEHLNGSGDSVTKFVNTGIPVLLEKVKSNGSDLNTIAIYMAGGANMLINTQLSKTFDIGTRNVKSAITTFEKMKLRIANSEVGGNTGRTVRLYIATGRMTVRVIGGTEKEL